MCREKRPQHVYYGREGKAEYFRVLNELGRDTVSPGGVGQLLRVSRQRVHKLLDDERMESWQWYERPGAQMAYCEVLVDDVRRLMEERGLSLIGLGIDGVNAEC